MRVLVTGASGFIGRNVLLRAPREWDIVAVYNQAASLRTFVALNHLDHVRAEHCDLTNAESVRTMLKAAGGPIDAVLYLAANADPAVSAEAPARDLHHNTVALVTLLEQCHAGHVVYVSSGAVYDGLQGAVSPQTPVSPLLPYAISKLASEQYLRFFCERKGSVGSFINVRFFGAYGPYEATRKITTRWLSAVAAGQREFVIRGNGENLIDFMYVDDAVDGFLSLVKAGGARLTVDLASGTPVTVNQVVGAMAGVMGVDISVRHEGHTEEFIEFRSVDTTMRDRFGFAPTISLPDGLGRLRAHLETAAHGQA